MGYLPCANKKLTDRNPARSVGKFTGFVVSDAGAIDYMRTEHKYRETEWDTVAAALTAGVNLEAIHQRPCYKSKSGKLLLVNTIVLSYYDNSVVKHSKVRL